MIFATAGHVDHGKTTLIRALTGKNTDQLAEEQRRGLTIDLGFAWLHDSEAGTLGFVDVPGHARFIRTMLAGLAGVDAALLVVAADEGPMPQTVEHLNLLDLLGIQHGIVVMTAAGRADSQQLSGCRAAIDSLIRESALSGSPVMTVDAVTGQGLPELMAAIRQLANATPIRPAAGPPRFLIDRRFTVSGAGCVVTGTLVNGKLSLIEPPSLCIAPVARKLRIRHMEIDGQAVTTITNGQRAALNLSGDLSDDHPQRGDWLLQEDLFQTSERLDVQLRVLPMQKVHHGTLQILTGATAVSGKLAWLDESAGLAQLLLDKPVHALVGDVVIVREPAANITLAGGRVCDPQGRQRGRRRTEAVARLSALSGVYCAHHALEIELRHQPEVKLTEFARRWYLDRDTLVGVMAGTSLVKLGEMALDQELYTETKTRLLDNLHSAHASHPELKGLHQPALLSSVTSRLSPTTINTIINQLVTQGLIRRHGSMLALPDHQPVLPPEVQALWPRIQIEIRQAGLRPPIVGELGDKLGLGRGDMLALLQRLQGWGFVLPVAPNRFYLPEQLDELAAVAFALCQDSKDGGFVAAEYRDRSGIGRNLTIKVLEYLDRAGVTYYRGERRFMRHAWLSLRGHQHN